MRKNTVWLVVRMTAMLMLTGVASRGATSTSTWVTAANGDWTNAPSWTGGIPTPDSEARLTVSGGSYTSTWSGGGSAFEDLVITNTAGNTTTLNIDAAGFENTNGIVRLNRGARMYVRPGGEWRWSGSNNVAAPMIAIDNDAELHIDGGSMIFSNVVGKAGDYAAFRLGTVAGSTGLVYVSSGRLEFWNNINSYSGLKIGPAGRGLVYQTGGTVFIQNTKGQNNPAGQYDFQVGNGEYNISGGLLLICCYMQVGGSSTGGMLRISGSGVVTNLVSRYGYVGTGAGQYGELNVSGGKYVDPSLMFFGGDTGTGVLKVTGGQLIMAAVNLGNNTVATGVGRGIGTISGGYVCIGEGYLGITIASTSYSNQNVRGELTMTGGTLEIKNPGQDGWSHLAGLVLGYSHTNNSTGVARGEFNLSGGAVTNTDGGCGAYLILGYNPGSIGIMTQTGGRYVQTGGRTGPAVVGYGGGSGVLTISNGVFELSSKFQPLYVGGYTETNSVYRYNHGWTTNDNYAGTGPSTGRLEMAGGTLRIAGSLIVATNGQGTAVFSGGTTTATDLNLVGAGATLRFKLGAADAGTLTVTNMTVGAGAKLEVDASAYDMSNGRRVKLVGCGARTGSFSPENITTSGRAAVVDQAGGANIWLKFNTGTIITIR